MGMPEYQKLRAADAKDGGRGGRRTRRTGRDGRDKTKSNNPTQMGGENIYIYPGGGGYNQDLQITPNLIET